MRGPQIKNFIIRYRTPVALIDDNDMQIDVNKTLFLVHSLLPALT
jgi:hypothetical protein